MSILLKPARALALALAAWPTVAALAADLSIMPVAVQLDRLRDRATVQVSNRGSEPVILQAEAIAWTREGGIDRDAPTADLIVNPPVFSVPPGQTQIVRLGLRPGSRAAAENESTYRLVLREVPSPNLADGLGVSGNVRVLVALRVPVYVAPPTVRRDERWHVSRAADGQLVAQVRNAGNVHLKVGLLRLHEGDATAAPMAEQAVGAVLFPGEAHSFRLRPVRPLSGQPLRLELMTDRGPQQVAVALDPSPPPSFAEMPAERRPQHVAVASDPPSR